MLRMAPLLRMVPPPKGIPTPSVKRQRQGPIGMYCVHDDAPHDAWEWVWDRFWNVTMHSNGTLPLMLTLDAPLDARCGYSLRMEPPKDGAPQGQTGVKTLPCGRLKKDRNAITYSIQASIAFNIS